MSGHHDIDFSLLPADIIVDAMLPRFVSTAAARRASIAAVLLLAVAAGSLALFRADPWADRGSGLPAGFSLDLQTHLSVDPALLRFTQTAAIAVPFSGLRAVAVGPQDRIYVAADRAVHIVRSDGTPQGMLQLGGQPTCLAVAGTSHIAPGRVYVGTGRQIELFDATGAAAGTWPGLSEKSLLTSIAVGANDVFVADAGMRVVLRYSGEGKMIGQIGRRDPDRQMPDFIIPSAYFDVALGLDGEVCAVNPGARRVQMYTYDGDLEGFWGQAGPGIEGFFGCCNPAHLAVLPNGQFVTSEKGIPRIKVYSEQGDFDGVVAGPQQLGVSAAAIGDPRALEGQPVFDIATDRHGRVLVLDPIARMVRIFARTPSGPRVNGNGEVPGK